jgi:UDP-N-acetylmuramoyl-L-alanyl-D-glutamate--2,6-diaminopimelate ligase
MRLSDLAAAVAGVRVTQGGGTEVRRVVYDSRAVEPGDLFVAVRGANVDGTAFAADAVARGATAVAAEHPLELPAHAGLLIVPDARQALGDLAHELYGRPSEQLRLVGVTGTDGKTTTSQLIAHVLAAAGRTVGWMTTVDVRIGDEIMPNPYGHTTPEASDVHALLARFVEHGVQDAVIEVSSHALALERVRGVSFDVAVFTNLAPEHLDFHHTMDEYAAAKARLFAMLSAPTTKHVERFGVVNADDPYSLAMIAESEVGIVSFALETPADVMAANVRTSLHGSEFTLVTPIGDHDVTTPLIGRHNVANWLAAAGVALGWGIDLDALVDAAARVEAPRGRMQLVQHGQPFNVVVDFAHTPQAMAATLHTLRTHTDGELFLVFGLAGGRDAANRPRMGELATQNTDFFVISTDDPLHEDPAAIAASVAAGARGAGAVEGRDFTVELDRKAAIQLVLERARPGDTVLLAGKGHERRMLIGDRAEWWSDEEVAGGILAQLGYR